MMKWINNLKEKSWTRYWMAHVVISLIISGAFMIVGTKALPFVGAAVYLAREITQKEYEEEFDWVGLLFPVLVCVLLAWAF